MKNKTLQRIGFVLKACLIGCCLLFFTDNSQAQGRRDFELWKGISLSKEVAKNFEIGISDQLRLNGNATYFKMNFTDVEFAYKFHKMFRASTGYRFTFRPTEFRHRVFLGGTFRYKVKKIRTAFSLRLRGQAVFSSDQTEVPEYAARLRFMIRYSPKGKVWKKFAFFGTGEIFYYVAKPVHDFQKYRFSAGFEYEMMKSASIKVRYIFQDEFNVAAPTQVHALNVGIAVELPKYKKKKKKKEVETD